VTVRPYGEVGYGSSDSNPDPTPAAERPPGLQDTGRAKGGATRAQRQSTPASDGPKTRQGRRGLVGLLVPAPLRCRTLPPEYRQKSRYAQGWGRVYGNRSRGWGAVPDSENSVTTGPDAPPFLNSEPRAGRRSRAQRPFDDSLQAVQRAPGPLPYRPFDHMTHMNSPRTHRDVARRVLGAPRREGYP